MSYVPYTPPTPCSPLIIDEIRGMQETKLFAGFSRIMGVARKKLYLYAYLRKIEKILPSFIFKIGAILKGKNLFLMGANSFLLE